MLETDVPRGMPAGDILKAAFSMQSQNLKCDNCKRMISPWVQELGHTLGHGKKNYCRFCYVRFRNEGKIRARADDSEFIKGINWELEWTEEVERKCKGQHRSTCPACSAELLYNLRGHANAEGLCPKCNAHIQIAQSGAIKLVSVRESIVLSVARRSGGEPDGVENLYAFILDEIAARLAEHSLLQIPELGTFRVRKPESTGANTTIEFNPSRSLLARIAGTK